MKLRKIKINNFLSHSGTELSLSDNHKFLIDGKSGAGKSSIADALVWALYGKGRAENRSLIKRGKKYATVSVLLVSSDNTEYNITRSITSAGKHDLSVTSKKVVDKQFLPVKVSGIKNLQEFIEKEILHSSYALFTNSVICLQDNENSFVSSSAARRKEIILEIVNASDYDEYYEKTKDKVKELEIVTESRGMEIITLGNKLKEERGGLQNLLILKESFDKTTKEEKKKKIDLEFILEKESEINSIDSKMSDKKTELINIYDNTQKLEMEIKDLKQKKSSLSSMDTNDLEKEIEKKKGELIELRKLSDKANSWNEKMMELVNLAPVDKNYEEIEKRLNSQIIVLMKKDIESCPEIGKSCPIIVKERDSRVLELSNDLNRTIKEKKECLKDKEEYNKQVENLGEKPITNTFEISDLECYIERNEKKIKEAEQVTTDIIIEISVKEKELGTLTETSHKISRKIEELGLKLDKLKIEHPLENIEKLIEEYNNLVSCNQKISQEIAITKNNLTRIEREEKELEVLKRDIKNDQEALESTRLLKDAFGNNGIKAIVIDYVLPKLEDRINEILSKLSDFRIRLNTQTKTVSGESVKEGLYIDIINDQGEVMDFDSYSGGEKVKISFSIFFGFGSFCNCKFKIFDETVIGLDSETVSSFIEILNSDIFKGIKQVLMISHISEIKDCFSEKLEIVKRNGTSVLK